MSELLRDAWIQVFGTVAALCLIIMGAERLASRPPAPAPPPAAVAPRAVEPAALSAPLPMTNAPKPVPSPLPIPPADSVMGGEPDDDAPAVPAPAPPAEPTAAQLKIIKLNGPARWNKDIFRKKK